MIGHWILFKLLSRSCLTFDRELFITSHFCTASQTFRGNNAIGTWLCQRDDPQLLSSFEGTLMARFRDIFFVSFNQVITLDDEMTGTRARDNTVKSVSSWKADKEGHFADAGFQGRQVTGICGA